MILDAEGEDGPEPFSGDAIDVGQLAEEFFALGIDPYPRKAACGAGRTDDGCRCRSWTALRAVEGIEARRLRRG